MTDSNFAPSLQDSAAIRNTSRPVMLIGFQEQANLGLGYLAATLRREGYRVVVFDFESERENILAAAKDLQPVLLGFSLIFQFYIDRFGALIRYLRAHGVNCHFTMGGHFPSLSSEHTLKLVPELDSVVRFEGEATLLELVDHLSAGREWRDIAGLAYSVDGAIRLTPPRPLVSDLDSLPYPDRTAGRATTILGRRAMPLLASRGCIRTCSFCSIHVFYRTAPGKVVRTRQPLKVVEEMRHLFEQQGVTIFLFQDDDFPVFGPVWQRWAREFAAELHRAGLVGRVIWKINCRADAVDPKLFAELKRAGLFMVYMGLESGSEEGLTTLHKQITAEQNLRAVATLKELGIMFEFGFMLFDPSTTFESVAANLCFLRAIVADGAAPATFCRMIPYDGTPIKAELARSGRLKGDICHPDYDFLDPAVDAFFQALNQIVHVSGWIHGVGALTVQLQYIKGEVAVMNTLFPALEGFDHYREQVQAITAGANAVLFDVIEQVMTAYRDHSSHRWTPQAVKAASEGFQRRLLDQRTTFVRRNQSVMLEALGLDGEETRVQDRRAAADSPDEAGLQE